VLSVVAGLALVKVIAKEVPADEYGKASLVLGIVALLNTVLLGPLLTTHLRLFFDYTTTGNAKWFVRTFNWILFATLPLVLLLYLGIAFFYQASGNQIFLLLLVPACALLFSQAFLSITTNYLEANRRHRRLAAVNILQKLFGILILYVMLRTLSSGATSILLAQAAAALLLILIFFSSSQRVSNQQRTLSTKAPRLKDLRIAILSFGWALPLGYMVQWLLTSGDRYLIEHFRSLKEVGIYAMNYGFWSMPFLMLNGWLEILTRPLLYPSAARQDWDRVKRILSFRAALGVGVSLLGIVFICFFGERIASWMLGAKYWGGSKLMLIITFAHCFYVLGYSICPAFLSAKKTKPILVATCMAAGTNLLLNWFLIPAYGMEGAALSTLLSYCIWVASLLGAATFTFRSVGAAPLPALS
jgi:O-antigen/teichoic acid export membrane protein